MPPITPTMMKARGIELGILNPAIIRAMNPIAIALEICKTFILRVERRLGPMPAAIITRIVAIIPAKRAVRILSLIGPSSRAAEVSAPGPARKSTPNIKALDGMNKPARAANETVPFKLPMLRSMVSLFAFFAIVLSFINIGIWVSLYI